MLRTLGVDLDERRSETVLCAVVVQVDGLHRYLFCLMSEQLAFAEARGEGSVERGQSRSQIRHTDVRSLCPDGDFVGDDVESAPCVAHEHAECARRWLEGVHLPFHTHEVCSQQREIAIVGADVQYRVTRVEDSKHVCCQSWLKEPIAEQLGRNRLW